MIRVQDVRATEKDRVKIADCFRGGDVVKGLVVSACSMGSHVIIHEFDPVSQISLGDARSYYITTARNDLGVIFAISEAGMLIQSLSAHGAHRILSYRCYNATCVLAGNAVSQDWSNRKAKVCQTRGSSIDFIDRANRV